MGMMAGKGVVLSFITVLLWAVSDVASRAVLSQWAVDPVVFTCLRFLMAALVLIIIAGPGLGGVATLRAPHTWLYGVFVILANVLFVTSLQVMTTTEAGFLVQISILLSLLVAWLFFNRRPIWEDVTGSLLVLAGVAVIALGLDAATRPLGILLIALVAITGVARTMVAETHPESNRALTIKARCRVTGYVSLVTSLVFLGFAFAFAQVRAGLPADTAAMLPALGGLPDVADFLHLPTLLAGLVLGATVVPAGLYFFFYAAKVAKTEVFVMVSAFQPFLIFACEWLAAQGGWVDIRAVSLTDLAAGVVILAGSLVMLRGRGRKQAGETA